MATAEMIQELIRAHVTGDSERFRNVALQVASREARAGHRLAAGKIRDLLDETPPPPVAEPTPLARPPRDLEGILSASYPELSARDIVLEGEAERSFERILTEQRQSARLSEWGLEPRRRLLLHGPPGCGKTLSAGVLAAELSLPLYRVRVESLFSRFMGQTAVLLSEVFDHAARTRGVYLFDEFDSIGKHRADENDVGEARRIVSTFLQLLDADRSDSLLIAATNERGTIDRALFRRFDDVIPFENPSRKALRALIEMRTASYGFPAKTITGLVKKADGLSYADVTDAIVDSVKSMVLDRRDSLSGEDVARSLAEIAAQRTPSG